MNSPSSPEPSPRRAGDETQMRAWLKLHSELAELHARLEYIRLIVALGVRRIDS
jgi:hypothetical protein